MADDAALRLAVSQIPLLKTRAGPRDRALWPARLKEEYQALIQAVKVNKEKDTDWFRLQSDPEGTRAVKVNKEKDTDWFRLQSDPEGTRWTGSCWVIHELLRYDFNIEFELPVTYPDTAPALRLPELEGKTAKMYRGGSICLTEHFAPLWARNAPRFGLAHLLALGLAPWLAVEIPDLIQKGLVVHKQQQS